MARANLKKVNTSQLLLTQHQSTYPRAPESASIEIPPLRPHFIKFSKTGFYQVNLVSQCSQLEVLLLSKFGPLGYVPCHTVLLHLGIMTLGYKRCNKCLCTTLYILHALF